MHVRCRVCDRLVHRYLRLIHLADRHPVLAATFSQERADIGVLFSALN